MKYKVQVSSKHHPHMVESTLEEYVRYESRKLEIDHVNLYEGKLNIWLKSYGLASWVVEIDPADILKAIAKE